jgi:hypothetical protein
MHAAGAPPPAGSGLTPPNPIVVRPVTPAPLTVQPVATAKAAATAAPLRAGSCRGIDLKHLTPGTKVPLSCFPQLPARSGRNTVTPQMTKQGHFRPMAGTGASIDLTAGAGCGSSGALYSVGCSMTWEAANLNDWSTSDSYADYYIPANSTTATLVTSGYAWNASTAHTTSLSAQGTWTFFTYDLTAQVIVATVYVNAGAPFQVFVYQDPYHTQQSYQFDVAYSQYAYVYLPNVSTTDTYVVYVMSTGVNSYCTYLTPAATPAPPAPSPRPTGAPASLVCNPNNSPGISAPSGTLSLQWALNSSYQAGAYSVIVFDKTAGSALGQAQVSLTGVAGYTFQLYPTPAANPTPAAVSTPPTTRFAWDSVNEQSTGGIVASVANQIGTAPTNGTYRMVVSDPDGQVVGIPATNSVPATCTSLSNSAANCTVTGTFQFSAANPALVTPGTYPNNTWTIQLYAPANQEMEASQAFQIYGYSLQTLFNQNGVNGQTLTFGCCAGGVYNIPNVKMVFTNNGQVTYPFAADPLKGIEYTTGPASSLASNFTGGALSNTTGYGVTVALTGCTGTYNTTGCSETVTDSTGGSWTVVDYCSVANPAAPANPTGSQCVLKFTPNNNNNLVPGASITVSNMTFYAYGGQGGWSCYFVPCSTATSVLPIDGLSWSSTSSSSPAWSPVYFGSSTSTLIGTANAHFIGSATFPGNTSRNAVAEATSPPNSPWINTHFYPATFTQGEYQNTTPFQAATGREDILVVNLSLCTGAGAPAPACSGASGLPAIGEVLLTFPAGVNASQITVDPSEPTLPNGDGYYVLATTGANACINTPPTNAVCLNPGGTAYNAGGNNANQGITAAAGAQGQIWLDVPASQASYIAQELAVQGYSTAELAYFTLTPDGHTTTPVVGGAAAGTAVDSLSLQGYSLNANLMGAQFNPNTVSPNGGSTTYSLTFQNTSSAADPNPDPVDAIVLEQTTSNAWTLSAPTFSGTGSGGWSNLSGGGYNLAGNTLEYWFGVCANQYTNHTTAGPPQPPTGPTYPTTAQPSLGAGCTAAQEQDAIAPGGSLNINFTLANSSTGTQTFYVYAHGANGSGWANLKTVTVNSVAESASAKLFSAAQGATDAACSTSSNIATNTIAQVAKSPNCFIYEVTNTSGGAQKIGTVDIALPAFDINGLATSNGPPVDWSLVGSPITQYVQLGTISGGTFKTTGVPAGCAVNAVNTFQPVPGSTAGQIEVSGCTGLSPGSNIAVEFVANTPQVQSNSYLLPAKIDGITAGNAWIGSDQVQVAFSLGLSVTVDPSNPGPGGSHPSPSCNPAQCAFSGTVLDFGTIAASGTVTGTDVVRATVVYEGGTLAGTCPAGAGVAANTWQLEVAVSSNPNNELYTSVDEPNSTSGLTYAAGVGSYFNPTTTSSVLSCGNETSGTNYDTIMNFQTQVGSDTNAHIVTVTYTLIGN